MPDIRTTVRRLPETTKAVALLAAVLIVFANPFFLEGKNFSPMDVLYSYYPWRAVAPAEYEGPSNHLRWDDATKFYPVRVNLFRSFRQEGVTFWQTEHLSGTPNRPTLDLYALPFYPLAWLFFFLPFGVANSLFHVLHLFIGGVSMWLLLREHRLRTQAALLGAVVYMLNGYFVVWLSSLFLPAALAWLPCLLFLFERMMNRRNAIYALIIALIIAWQFVLGYPPGSVLFLTLMILYCSVACVTRWMRNEWKTVAYGAVWMAVAVILAAGLSALYLIPTFEQLGASSYISSRTSGLFSMPLQFLLGFLFPNYWGNPTGTMGNVWIGWGNYCELIAYWGIVPLIIAVFGLFFGRKHNPLYLFALLALLLSLSLAYGIWPLKYLRALPGLSQTVPARWHCGIALAGSIFSSMGLEYLMARQHKRASVVLITAVTASLLAYIVATIASPDIIRTRFADYPLLIQSHFRQIGLAGATLILLATYAALHKRFPRLLFGALVIAFTLGDLLGFAIGFNPYIADHELYPDTPGIRFLQSQAEPYRAVPWGPFPGVLPAYTANVYGIPIVTGLDHYRERSYQEFLGPLMSDDAQQTAQKFGYVRLDQGIDTNHSVLDLLNARYIVTTPDGISSDRLTVAYEGPDMRVYENPSALPRAWGVPNYELLSHDDALLRVHQADFDPVDTVLLETPPPLAVEGSSCSSQELESGLMVYTNDEIVAQTDFACDGFLVISERFAPGWEATVDGTPSAVLRADYLLRAVQIPAGQHTVHLRYYPSANRRGAAISLAFLVMWCGLAGFLWKRWRGAALMGLLVPTAVVLWFAQPLREPPPVPDRWVGIETPVPDSIAPQAQTAHWRDELGTIEFLGYEIDRTSVAPGSRLRLTLFWRSGPRVARDYTVFTHLLDSGLQRWAQQDKLPLGGMAPTSSWQDGEVIADIFDLTVSPTAPATTGHLEIGLYDWMTGERMPLFDESGNRLANDVLVLDSEIEIKP